MVCLVLSIESSHHFHVCLILSLAPRCTPFIPEPTQLHEPCPPYTAPCTSHLSHTGAMVLLRVRGNTRADGRLQPLLITPLLLLLHTAQGGRQIVTNKR